MEERSVVRYDPEAPWKQEGSGLRRRHLLRAGTVYPHRLLCMGWSQWRCRPQNGCVGFLLHLPRTTDSERDVHLSRSHRGRGGYPRRMDSDSSCEQEERQDSVVVAPPSRVTRKRGWDSNPTPSLFFPQAEEELLFGRRENGWLTGPT